MTATSFVRRSDVVTRFEGAEALVLDLRSDSAHCLSGDVALVWQAAESATTVAAVVAATGLETDAVEVALSELNELDLVTITAGGLGRRTLLLRGAAVGGAVVAAGVVSIPLPASARANSATFALGGSCTSSGGLATRTLTVTRSGGGTLTPNATYTFVLTYKNHGNTTYAPTFTVKANADGTAFLSGSASAVSDSGTATNESNNNNNNRTTVSVNSTGVLSITTGHGWGSQTAASLKISNGTGDQQTIALTSLPAC